MPNKLDYRLVEVVIFILMLVIFAMVYSKGLIIGGERMFVAHDTSQPARIEQFVTNLERLHIPPRIAPEMSFRMGWPLFGMYATFAYWMAAAIFFVTRLDIIDVLRLNYHMVLVFGLVSSYLFLRRHHSMSPSILGAAIYSTSSYIATNIFLRGALAESWYIAMLPIALLGVSLAGSKNATRKSIIFGYMAVGLFMLTHNSLAPLTLVLIGAYGMTRHNKKNVFVVMMLGVFLSLHFLLPMILQNRYTHAFEISTRIKPETNFLCAWQLWDSEIGYGGSIGGCEDQMPFNVGKPQLIIYVASLLVFLVALVRSRDKRKYIVSTLFAVWSIVMMFMTLYESSFVWQIFYKFLALIQFPWRFIGVSLIGIAFVVATASEYALASVMTQFRRLFEISLITVGFIIIIYQSRYFINDQHTMSVSDYKSFYFSKGAIWDRMSYGYIELMPKSVNIEYYDKFSPYGSPHILPSFYDNENTLPFEVKAGQMKVLSNDPFYRAAEVIGVKGDIYVNVHAHPYWTISIDGKDRSSWEFYKSKNVDKLGRPMIGSLTSGKHLIEVRYSQTMIEHISNTISLASLVLILIFALYKKPDTSIITASSDQSI